MTDLFASLEYLHFLRPAWLVLAPAALLLWWWVRAKATAHPKPPAGIAPHLAAALTVGDSGRLRLLAIDGITLTLILLSLAAAGPTWSRAPNPLIAQTAPLAVVISLAESMASKDLPPSRVERARQKFLDLLATRAGARTALIAYAGSAHQVVPLTEDAEVLKPFAEGLSPQIMPSAGRNATVALELARETLSAEQVPGAILFITDVLDSTDLAAFKANAAEDGPRVVFLSVGGLKRVPGAAVVVVTPDDADVREVERRVAAAYRDALAGDERLQWNDRGWLFAWPAALLTLLWFRRGWTMHWGVLLVAFLIMPLPGPADAAGIADWFLTPDQQGRLAFEDKRFAEAAELFQEPFWKGYALYSAGDYVEAAQVYARLNSPQAAFAQGVAHVKGREYRKGINAFEQALRLDPGYAEATRNLEIARAILAYVESAREQSDTQEGSEGADEVVFDKEAKGGAEMQITGETQLKLETAQQWMRGVNTRTADFLRIRFALEAAKGAP